MKGSPVLSRQHVLTGNGNQWIAGLGDGLRGAKRLKHPFKGTLPVDILVSPSGVWFVVAISRKVKLGILAAPNLSGRIEAQLAGERSGKLTLKARGGFGSFRITLAQIKGGSPFLRLTTVLTPSQNLKIESVPLDLCVLDHDLNPYAGEGRLMTRQSENSAAHAYFAVEEQPGAAVFYFQNLSALSDYFHHTGARISNAVSVQWPAAGFSLPAGEKPLPAGRPFVINDALIQIERRILESDQEAAAGFLDALARVYPLIEQPDTDYTDWPGIALATLRTFDTCRECCPKVSGTRFFQAYIGSSAKPPEAMVQGALLVPLMEYEEHRGRPVPLLREMRDVPSAFYHPKTKELVRWLPGQPFHKEDRSEEEHRFRMDSWYLLHAMLNCSRLAEMGMMSARTTFFKALPRVIETARHFNYDWPVFYDQRNLKVYKRETSDGEGGEQDVPALYVKLMLSAYSLTHKPEYLSEAETAAARMQGLAFGTLYQTNNTVMGAVGLSRLWKLTGKTEYRDLSIISIASALSHLWLWSLKPGTRTFMALPPLHEAPYVAFYEEAEILASLSVWQGDMGDEIPRGARLLLAEYQKHLLSRAKYYYPSELPEEMVDSQAKEGPVIRPLRVPIEGLGPPYEKAGTVGQAVYAAAGPFILTTRAWHHPAHAPFTVFCEYPVLSAHAGGSRRAGKATLRLAGVPELGCKLHILPSGKLKFRLTCSVEGKKLRLRKSGRNFHAVCPGGSTIEVRWN